MNAHEKILDEIAIRLPTAVTKRPKYAAYLGALLEVAHQASALTRHEVGVLISNTADLTGIECYIDPDHVPYRIGCQADCVTEYNTAGQVTRRRGALSFSDADLDKLSALILTESTPGLPRPV